MPLPVWTSMKHKNVNYEPIYNDMFEVIITGNDMNFLFQNIITSNYVNGHLVFTYREDESLDVSKFFRQSKLNILIDGKYSSEYELLMVRFNAKGETEEKIRFNDCEFIGCSDNMFHFGYKYHIDEYII